MPEEIWVCDTGEYEQAYTFGAWRSLDAAIASVKEEMYGPPYIVQWEDVEGPNKWDETLLTGHFTAVAGYSTRHTAYFSFRTWELSDD